MINCIFALLITVSSYETPCQMSEPALGRVALLRFRFRIHLKFVSNTGLGPSSIIDIVNTL